MDKSRKKELLQLSLSALLLLISYFVKNEVLFYVIIGIAYVISGYKVIFKAVRNIFHGQWLDENFLMMIATIGAIVIKEYNEAVFVMIFYNIGELFEKTAVEKSRKSITSLMDLCPDTVSVLRNGNIETVDPYDVEIGEMMIVKAGDKIPLDGIIEEGESFLDTAALTGESVPRRVRQGDEVMSGCINQTGLLHIKVTKRAEDSTVSKILNLIENSVDKKSKYESFISRFAKYYTPAVVIGAILVAIVPIFVFNADWKEQIRSAMIFLMISCPCALVISVPLTFFGGIGRASKMGILVKGANSLEDLSKIGTVAFDKTGTLTKGIFTVTDIIAYSAGEEKILEIAAKTECFSSHPIAVSLKEKYGYEIDESSIKNVEEKAGMGVCAEVDGKKVFVGNKKLMNYAGIEPESVIDPSGTVVFVAEEKNCLGAVIISDVIKENSYEAISSLKAAGIKTVMLSGDKKNAVDSVSEKLGMDKAYSELMPDEKLEIVNSLVSSSEKGKCVAFVGDGINDAPVLACADVSVAMGALGSDAAIEASDIVLVDDNPAHISKAIDLSKKAVLIAKENIVFSLAVKLAVLVLGAFGAATIWEAVFSDVGVSVIAILNATRILRFNKKSKDH